MNRNVPLLRNTPLVSRTPLQRSPWSRPALSLVVAGGAPVVPLRKAPARKDTIPDRVRKAAHRRDCRYCYVDGQWFPEGGIHLHHRRLKQNGGDPRPHTDCTCNLVSICWIHHAWIHDTPKGRAFAEAEGLIIPNVTPWPGALAVRVHGEDEGSGHQAWLTCDGHRVDAAPDGPGAA